MTPYSGMSRLAVSSPTVTGTRKGGRPPARAGRRGPAAEQYGEPRDDRGGEHAAHRGQQRPRRHGVGELVVGEQGKRDPRERQRDEHRHGAADPGVDHQRHPGGNRTGQRREGLEVVGRHGAAT